MTRVLVYGATGFSGSALARALAGTGSDLVIGGRDAAQLASLAGEIGADYRVFALGDPAAIVAQLQDIDLLVNAAGPFRDTALPLMLACIAAEVDYFDLCGEWPVFIDATRLDADARSAGIMLMPGAGFTIAASDCLLAATAAAAHAAATISALRAPVRMRLAVSRPPRMSRGSLKTILSLNSAAVRVCRKGQVVALPAGWPTRSFDFGDGPARAVAVSWPDVVTAAGTTGIDTIETYAEAGWLSQVAIRVGAALAPATRLPQASGWLAAIAASAPESPAATTRPFVLIAEAVDRYGRATRRALVCPDGYTMTTATAAAAVARHRAGSRQIGFTTPARAFGAEFIIGLGGAQLHERVPASQERNGDGVH